MYVYRGRGLTIGFLVNLLPPLTRFFFSIEIELTGRYVIRFWFSSMNSGSVNFFVSYFPHDFLSI